MNTWKLVSNKDEHRTYKCVNNPELSLEIFPKYTDKENEWMVSVVTHMLDEFLIPTRKMYEFKSKIRAEHFAKEWMGGHR